MVAYAPDAPTSCGHRNRLHFELWHRTSAPWSTRSRPAAPASVRSRRSTRLRAARTAAATLDGFDPTAFIAPLKLRRVDARRPPGARVRASSARRLGAFPRRGRQRRGRRGARDADGRDGQHHRVSAGADHVRADRRAGAALQQHRVERAREPVRDRARLAGAERHLQSARGVRPCRDRVRVRLDSRRPRRRDDQRRRRSVGGDLLQGSGAFRPVRAR